MSQELFDFLRAKIAGMESLIEESGPISRISLLSQINEAKKKLLELESEAEQEDFLSEPEPLQLTMKDMVGPSGPDLIDSIFWLSELIISPSENNANWLRYHLQRATQNWPDVEKANKLHEIVEEALTKLKHSG